MDNMNLKDLAMKAANPDNNAVETDEVPQIFIGTPNPVTPQVIEESTSAIEENEQEVEKKPVAIMPDLSDADMDPSIFTNDDDDKELKELLAHIPKDNIAESIAKLKEEKSKYKKQLIMDGFTPEEAEEASMNRIKKNAQQQDTEYANANPEIGVIRIDKTDTALNDLKLTPDEHEKLVTTKAIKLVLVEDAELKNIEIESVATERKIDYIRNLEGSLSKYSVPIPIYGDYMSFRGAQLIQIANLESREDDRLEDDLNRKASLIYSKLIGGSLLKKSDNNGKTIMSYQEFTNKFSYLDVDMAIYGILCASNPEEGSTELTCRKCSHTFSHEYNFKRLMTQEGLTDEIKQRYEDILENRTNDIELKKLHDATNGARRYKSPFTNNIYDIGVPSIARMIDVFKRINQEDSIMVHNSVFASFINALYIYNQNTGKYLKINDSEVDLMLDTISDIPQDDITMIQKQITQMSYSPRFEIKGECPSCGNKYTIPINVDNLLFFKQQDLQRAIE